MLIYFICKWHVSNTNHCPGNWQNKKWIYYIALMGNVKSAAKGDGRAYPCSFLKEGSCFWMNCQLQLFWICEFYQFFYNGIWLLTQEENGLPFGSSHIKMGFMVIKSKARIQHTGFKIKQQLLIPNHLLRHWFSRSDWRFRSGKSKVHCITSICLCFLKWFTL